jgi:two-component system cell cycle sensor histidine kinase/response regulator CckA
MPDEGPNPAVVTDAWLAALVESSGLAIISYRTDGRILTWNAAAEALYGYRAPEVVGRSPMLLVPEDRADELSDLCARLSAGEHVAPFATRRRRKDGREIDVTLSVSPVRDAAGTVVGLAAIASDATDANRREEQLRQAQKMEAIGRLSGGVAHDLNNVLTGILGYAMLALDRPDGEPVGPDLEKVVDAAGRATELTEQLLAFSRRQPVEPEVMDLTAAVQDAAPVLRRLVGPDVELVCALAPDLCPVVAEPTQVQQILMNLALNARDAMPEGGRLEIETATVELDAADHPGLRPGRHALLTVSDTGAGIEPGDRARVFEPFFTTKGSGAGTGLGLSTVFGIVEQHRGHVWVESEPGRGASFKLAFPVARAVPERGEEVRAGAPDEPRAAAGALLVVEDEEMVRVLAAEVLRDAGYDVVAAAGGEEALGLAAARPDGFDLVVTDVVMPGMRGPEVVARLGFPRALFMSGYTGEEAARDSMLGAGTPFLSKPFSPQSLLAAVRRALEPDDRPGAA